MQKASVIQPKSAPLSDLLRAWRSLAGDERHIAEGVQRTESGDLVGAQLGLLIGDNAESSLDALTCELGAGSLGAVEALPAYALEAEVEGVLSLWIRADTGSDAITRFLDAWSPGNASDLSVQVVEATDPTTQVAGLLLKDDKTGEAGVIYAKAVKMSR